MKRMSREYTHRSKEEKLRIVKRYLAGESPLVLKKEAEVVKLKKAMELKGGGIRGR
jgi:hypothetical protein